jgi:hypothetical protein
MKSVGRGSAHRGRIALLSLLACGAFFGSGASPAGAQTIENQAGVSSPTQTVWLTSFTTVGQASGDKRAIRLSMLVKHPAGVDVTALKIDQNWDGDDGDFGTHSGISVEQPNIVAGLDYSRINYSFQTTNDMTGNTTRTADATLRVRAVLNNSTETTTSNSLVRFIGDSNGIGFQDVPHINTWNSSGGNFFRELTPGQNFTFSYIGDDPDTDTPVFGSSDDVFDGVRWRTRDQLDGNPLSGTTNDCDGGNDNGQKDTTVTFPNRGSFVVEGETMNEGCNLASSGGGRWMPLGSVDVNSSTIPAPTGVGATRPVINGNTTVSATMPTDPDNANGGRVQYVEWDLDGNSGNGVSGFDQTTLGTHTGGLTGTHQKVFDTEGMSPGLKTVRVRVTDNGAMSAADSNRATSSIVSATYLVDTPPVVNDQTITTDTNATNAPINLGATDTNGDSLTYSVTGANLPDNGTLSNPTTDDPTYTPNAGFAGTDSFVVTVSDGFGGTDTATVTVNVRPNTTITSNPTNPSNDPTPSFQFTSNGSPVTFECRVTGEASFTACTSTKTYATLADGSKTFEVRAKAGTVLDASPATYTWTIDTIPPNTQIDASPPLLTNSTSASFQFSQTGGGTSFQCKLDTGAFANCTSPQNYTGLDEGSRTFQVRSTDAAGNTDLSPATYTWTVDTTGPATTINTFPDDPTNDTDATFSFSPDESVSGFECDLDGGGFTPCSSPKTYAGPLGEGFHTFSVRATDTAGNLGAEDSHTWEVDLTPPTATIADAPPSLSGSTMASFTYSSDEDPSTFECRLDAGPFVPCDTQPQQYSGLGQASHTFRVRATDEAGNTGPEDTHTWTVDTVPPNTFIDDEFVPPPPPPLTTETEATFSFLATADPNGPVTLECRLNSANEADFQPCTAPVTYTGLLDGPQKFEVRGRDLAGNVDPTPAKWEWGVYNGLPSTILDTFPANPSNDDPSVFAFTGTIPNSTFECKIDDEDWETCTSTKSYPGLDEDEHTFQVKATDPFDRIQDPPTTYTWTVDRTAPQAQITANPLDPTNSDDASFQFNSGEEDSLFECKLDSGDWEACDEDQPQVYTDLDEGSRTFLVRATDPAGNTGDPASFTWVIDLTNPVASITDQPDDPSNINNPAFEFSSNEDGSTFECSLDTPSGPGTFGPCETPLQYTDLVEGEHTFTVRATDPAGNLGDPATYTWTVDLTAPDTTITDGPDDPTNETLATFVFQGSDTHSDSSDLTFECRIDSSEETAWQSCDSPEDFSGVLEGVHTVEVRATDEAGNTDPIPAAYEWEIDLTGPLSTIVDGPDGPTTSTSVSVEFTSEAGATFECRLDSTDDNDWGVCTSPFTDTVGEGPHVFEVRATDTAGNTGPVAMHTWLVDQTGPETNITAQPGDPSNDTSPSFSFNGTDTPGSGVAGFECNLDSAGFEPCSSGHEYTGLTPDGSHNFQVRAIDNAGNPDGSPASYTWILDTEGPTMTFANEPSDPTNSTNAEFHMTSEAGASFECRIDSDEDADWQACGPFAAIYNSLPHGSHTWEARAIDTAGNKGPAVSYTWEIDTGEPDTEITANPPDPSNNASPQFAFSSTEDPSTFECRVDPTGPGGWTPCATPLTVTPALTDGQHTFEVRATDEADNTDSTPDSYTWLVDTTEPDTSITTIPPDPSNDTSPTFGINGSDPGGSGVASLECDLDGAGFEPCTDPAEYTGVTTEGPHTFKVRATDSAGNTDSTPAEYNWTLDTTAPGVNVDSGPADPTNVNSGSLAFTVTGSDVANTVCEVDGVPETANCPSGTVPVAGLSDGPHEFKVTSTDTAGNSNSDTWSWTVDTALPDTTIDTTPASPTTLTNVAFGFSSDESPATFECQMDSEPFAPCTTPYSHAPLLRGPHTFSVRATDAAGNTDATPDTHAFTVSEGAVLGGKPPQIKKRIRALNVPVEGSFQVATVTCRAGTCKIDQKSAVIKIAGKTYEGTISVQLVAKTSVDHLAKGDVAQVVVHFAPNVQRALVENHVGQLVVKISASTDAGGAAAFKKIKLKAKWLKALFR